MTRRRKRTRTRNKRRKVFMNNERNFYVYDFISRHSFFHRSIETHTHTHICLRFLHGSAFHTVHELTCFWPGGNSFHFYLIILDNFFISLQIKSVVCFLLRNAEIYCSSTAFANLFSGIVKRCFCKIDKKHKTVYSFLLMCNELVLFAGTQIIPNGLTDSKICP